MNIQQYIALTASILLFRNESQGQIIYTDVPDTTFANGVEGEVFIDLKNDGIADVSIKLERSDYTSINGTFYYNEVDLELNAIPKVGNRIIGMGNEAYALESNILIDINSPWVGNKLDMATFAFSLKQQIGGGSYNSSSWGGGPWYYNAGDRYLGVRFKSGSHVFYGWVRLLVTAPWLPVTLKDYAYQATADSGIYAGKNYATQIAIISEQDVLIHSSPGQTIEIHLYSPDFLGGKVTVTNILGQSVAVFNADNLITKQSLNRVSSGWYNVSVYKDGKQFNKSVMLY